MDMEQLFMSSDHQKHVQGLLWHQQNCEKWGFAEDVSTWSRDSANLSDPTTARQVIEKEGICGRHLDSSLIAI